LKNGKVVNLFSQIPFWEQSNKNIMSFGSDRQMFDVDLSCAKCGAHISQLPFQPSGDRPVYCSDCNRAFRDSRGGGTSGGFSRGPRAPRQMFDVDLTCAQCGTAIKQLPFQPSGDKPVYCKDCMMARRNG
jgi:CxxC-x17-CxxC domain-containing protein